MPAPPPPSTMALLGLPAQSGRRDDELRRQAPRTGAGRRGNPTRWRRAMGAAPALRSASAPGSRVAVLRDRLAGGVDDRGSDALVHLGADPHVRLAPEAPGVLPRDLLERRRVVVCSDRD